MRRLLLIIISFAILSCSPVRKYQSLPDVKAWETQIQAFEELTNKETYPGESVLFAGSSSIRLWSTLGKDMEPYPVIQRGYGGAKLSDFAVYADRILNPPVCMAIVIFIANDISGSEKDRSPEEVLSLYSNVVNTIRKKHSDTPVFWIAITPTSSRWKVWPEIQKANDLIKEYCDNNRNTYFIRTDYAFLGENGKPKDELFKDDLLHLNEKGYAVWTEIIKKELDLTLQQ